MDNVVVLGSLHLDILVHAADRPKKGETLRGTQWGMVCGGKGGNQAVQAAQQGAAVHMIGRVGKDDFAGQLLDNLNRAQIDTTYVTVDDTAGSGMSVAMLDAEGDYAAIIVSGANLNIDESDIERASAVIQNADYLLLQYEVTLATVLAAARYARQHGVKVMLNPAPAYPAPVGLLDNVDVLVVNEVEAEMLTGVSVATLEAAAQAAKVLRESVPTVLVTLGGRGVLVADQAADKVTHVPAYAVKVVDTHGAGDAFIGALAAQLAGGVPLLTAVRYANATAALMVMNMGPVAPDLTPDKVRAFMAAHGEQP